MAMMLYQIKNLCKQRTQGQHYTLEIPHLSLNKGDMLALTGPSGCGKSTTLDLLGLALGSDSAEQFIFTPASSSYDLQSLHAKAQVETLAYLRKQYIGYVLQTGELLPYLSTLENMTLTARLKGTQREICEELAFCLAQKLGLAAHLLTKPTLLSVGERQRVAIIRALLPRPVLLLADEPTAALDPLHATTVMDSLVNLVKEQGTTLILVTHDQSLSKTYGLQQAVYNLTQTAEHVTATLTLL